MAKRMLWLAALLTIVACASPVKVEDAAERLVLEERVQVLQERVLELEALLSARVSAVPDAVPCVPAKPGISAQPTGSAPRPEPGVSAAPSK